VVVDLRNRIFTSFAVVLAVMFNFWDVVSGRRRRTCSSIRTTEVDGNIPHIPGIREGTFDII